MAEIVAALSIPISIVLLYPLAIYLVRSHLPDMFRALSDVGKMGPSVEALSSNLDELKDVEGFLEKLNDKFELMETMSARIALLQDQIDAFREQQTAAAQPDATEKQLSGWEEIYSTWQRARLAIEHRIAEIPDGRSRKWYNNQERRDYRPIIERLQAGGELDEADANILSEMNTIYLSFRNQKRKPTPRDVTGYSELFSKVSLAE